MASAMTAVSVVLLWRFSPAGSCFLGPGSATLGPSLWTQSSDPKFSKGLPSRAFPLPAPAANKRHPQNGLSLSLQCGHESTSSQGEWTWSVARRAGGVQNGPMKLEARVVGQGSEFPESI